MKLIFNLSVIIVFLSAVSFLFFFEKEEDKSLLTSSAGFAETVIIDAGHGGEDGGAVGVQQGILEKEINLITSQKLEHLLNLFGINTDMTRRDDISLSSDDSVPIRQRKISDIKQRVDQIVNTPNATLISVHQNSFPQDTSCKGAQVFYSDNNVRSKPLAENIQSALKDGIKNDNNRVVKESDSSIYILNNVNCPAILVECGFLTNKEESELLMTDTYRTKLAACIASGFLEYHNEK